MLVNTRWLAPLATSHDTFKASRGMKLEAAHCCGERERGDGGGGGGKLGMAGGRANSYMGVWDTWGA